MVRACTLEGRLLQSGLDGAVQFRQPISIVIRGTLNQTGMQSLYRAGFWWAESFPSVSKYYNIVRKSRHRDRIVFISHSASPSPDGQYNDKSSNCIAVECVVKLADGKKFEAKALKHGMKCG